MRYQVQYAVGEHRRTAEVEASSPAEAVVKFRAINEHAGRSQQEGKVLSVWAERAIDEICW